MRVSFIIYADFKWFTENMDTSQLDSSRAYTKAYQLRQPSGFCYHIKYVYGDYQASVCSCGEDAAKKFVKCIKKDIGEIVKTYETKIAMEITD